MNEKSFGLLEGKKGIIFGPLDESSIGWHIATAAYREGATLAISNIKVAIRMGRVKELAKLCGEAPLIACDASSNEDLERTFAEVKET